MTDFVSPLELTMLGKVIVAAILGGLVGIERAEAHTAAGLRTNMVVAISTCMFTVICLHLFQPGFEHNSAMLGHIISGVGFIGAGIVFHYGRKTAGLTTAASVWLVAAIGMTVGVGLFILAIFSTALTICILHYLEPLSVQLQKHGHRIDVVAKRHAKEAATPVRSLRDKRK